MKRITAIVTFLLISLNGLCDTIDYWHVYINDKLVAEFNENSKDLTINIKKSELKSSDNITVRYGSDTPCVDCIYGLTIPAEIKRSLPKAETKEHFGKLSIPVKELLDIEKMYGITKFPFNYYEKTNNTMDGQTGRLVLILIIV